ncbi:MAG: MotA/TolQ/ExbB proton channel family protein [Gaiellales bacterium]
MAEDPTTPGEVTTKSGGSDPGLLVGIPLSFGCIIGGLLIEHANPAAYVGISPALFVFGGTLGVTTGAVGLKGIQKLPSLMAKAVTYRPQDRVGAIKTLVTFAEKARREGLLVLEDDLRDCEDEFLRRGVQLVVDGTDPELVKEILRTEVDSLHEELHAEAKTFELMHGVAPTMGIIGTVIGLVVTLSNIADASSLAAAIAVAFLATLYGVSSANLIWLPIGVKLQGSADDQVATREMMIEGILAIQSGDNPRIVEEKLIAFLSIRDRAAYRAALDTGGPEEMDLAA